MSKEGMEGLFQIFGKLKQTQVANASGCGLGLSISKQLAVLMGGDFEVSSTLGKGSKFSFTVAMDRWTKKLSSQDSDSDTHSKSSRSSGDGKDSGKGSSNSSSWHLAQALGEGLSSSKFKSSLEACSSAHLLCAEDNLFNVEVLRAFVSGSRMKMTCVENGQLAFDAYTSNPGKFDVILMDCQMPVMDGFEATAAIRAWERKSAAALQSMSNSRSAVPIIALTAYAMSLDRKKAVDAGMDSFLTKPVSKYALIHTIAEHVEGRIRNDMDGALGAKAKEKASKQRAKEKQERKAKASGGAGRSAGRGAAREEDEGEDDDDRTTHHSEHSGKSGLSSSAGLGSSSHEGSSGAWMPPGGAMDFNNPMSWKPDVSTAASPAVTDRTADGGGGASSGGSSGAGSAHGKKHRTAMQKQHSQAQRSWDDAPIVDTQAGLMQFGGSQDAHLQILEMFATEFLPSNRADIARHRKDKNYAALSKDVHSLKGASGFAVVSRIFNLAKELQRIMPVVEQPVLAEGEEDMVAKLLDLLEREADAFVQHYRDELADGASSSSKQQQQQEETAVASSSSPAAAATAASSSSAAARAPTADEKRLKGVRVLYAEDNPFCVSVIRAYLKSCNATIVSAGDGTDVVSKLVSGREKFDCVLMDCHMPVMDGFQALKVIRHWESDQGHEAIPIIGITAYAGHRESMLEGGMTGFLTKPVSRPTLIHTLAMCLDGREVEQDAEGDAAAKVEFGDAPQPVDMVAGTANFGSQGQYLELLARFRHSFAPEARTRITAALQAREQEALDKAVHLLKGSAGYVGAGVVFQVCAETRQRLAEAGVGWAVAEQQAALVLAEVQRACDFIDEDEMIQTAFAENAAATKASATDVHQAGTSTEEDDDSVDMV
jgi:CheY-like chemotaxis protein